MPVLAPREGFGVDGPAVPSLATAAAIRFSSVARPGDGWPGLAVGADCVVAAFADDISSAPPTAAARVAAATGTAMRIRRL